MNHAITLTALLAAAVMTGVIHTIAGPDHYLPFIAISRSRNYGLGKTLLWTILCGIGHVGSTILLAVFFLLFAEILTAAHIEWFENLRGDLAAYAMIGTGAAMLLYSLHRRLKKHPVEHKHVRADGSVVVHTHSHEVIHDKEKLSYWVIFIIFVLGPCEALLPLLTASAVLGTLSVVSVSLVFTLSTVLTMCAAVAAGRYGLSLLHFPRLEDYAPEIAGGTVMLCGLAILCIGV